MALHLIQKYKLDKSGKQPITQVFSQITERERRLLVDFFILDNFLTREEKKEVLHLCQSIHERDLWLQCDCLTGGNRKENSSSSTSRRSNLCKALYRLLDDAGVNVISSTNKVSAYKAIEQAALGIELQPKKNLIDYLYINPSSFYKAAYMLKGDQSYWSKEIRKHALMLVKVKEIHEQNLEVLLPDGTTKQIKISNRIYRSSGRFSARTAPFMAFILITDSIETPNFYQPFDAFVVPCYSEKTFIPVDSYYEREVLKRLFAIQFEWTQKGDALEIIKPLFDIEIDSEINGVLPDFILRTPEKQLIIEVNGSHEPEYLQRKQQVHEKMRKLGTVLSFDAYGAEKEDRLTYLMNQFIIQVKNHLTPIG